MGDQDLSNHASGDRQASSYGQWNRHATPRMTDRPTGIEVPTADAASLRSSRLSRVSSAFRQMMCDDRERLGLSIARASWLLGISVRQYRELEEGEDYLDSGTWARMVKVFESPQSFA